MGNRFASGKWAIAQCDRCDGRFKLKQLRKEIIKTKNYELLVCPECWDPDQPQLQLGMFPVDDPQGLRNPRPDRSYLVSGLSGLQIVNSDSPNTDAQGTVEGGSRIFEWGWNPVGGAAAWDSGLTPNNLFSHIQIGDVSIELDASPGASISGVSARGYVGNALGPLAITGVEAIGQAGNVFEIDMPITGVSATGAIPNGAGAFPIQINTALTDSAPGVTFNHVQESYYGGAERLVLYSSDPWAANLAAATAHTGNPSQFTVGETWVYADASNVGTPASPVPEICFGKVGGSQDLTSYYFLFLDTSVKPDPFPPYGSWTTYSGFRLETRFNVPCPNNGDNYFPDPPYDGYTPTYVNNGTTCTLSWSGNAAATLYDTYQHSVSIVGSRAYAKWNDVLYFQPGIIMGLVTAVTYTGGVFKITMNTITPVTGSYPITPISFIPTNPNLSYVSGVSETSAVGFVGQAITMAVSTPSQSVQFNSAPPDGYEFDVGTGTALGNWVATYGNQNYTRSYMFADIGGTYVGLGYLPGSWQVTPGPGSSYYYKGFVGQPIPSNFPGLGSYSFNNFVVAAQFYINLYLASSYASYSTAGGQATFTWTGDAALTLRDTYGVYPSLPVGAEISAVLNFKDINSVYTFRATLGTLLSMGYSSGTFSMTYTVVTPFTPAHNPIQYGDNWFQSEITFLPLVINI